MRLTIILSLLAAAVGLAACGSSDPSGAIGTGAASTGGAGKTGNALAFARCVRANGVPNFPDPSGNGQGGIQIQQSDRSGSGPSTKVNGVAVNGPAFQKAMQACRKYLPNGGHPSAAQTAKVKAQALAMARCMRSHGVPNFPDPQFQSGPGGGFGIRIGGAGINPNSPAFQAAQKACGGIFKGAHVADKAP
jgi:hypothetical protein